MVDELTIKKGGDRKRKRRWLVVVQWGLGAGVWRSCSALVICECYAMVKLVFREGCAVDMINKLISLITKYELES